jgi:hypothetical protein
MNVVYGYKCKKKPTEQCWNVFLVVGDSIDFAYCFVFAFLFLVVLMDQTSYVEHT